MLTFVAETEIEHQEILQSRLPSAIGTGILSFHVVISQYLASWTDVTRTPAHSDADQRRSTIDTRVAEAPKSVDEQ